MAASATFSGARAIFKINTDRVAYAGGVSGSEEIDYEPVDVLDLLEVREHVPVAYRVTLSAQVFRVVGSSLKQLGIMPNQSQIRLVDDLEATITDSVTEQTIALFQGVKCAGHTFDVTARGIVSENVNFVAIRVKDESGE